MDAATIALIVSALVKYGPEVARGIATIFNTPNPTLADWDKFVFDPARKTYEQYTAPKV